MLFGMAYVISYTFQAPVAIDAYLITPNMLLEMAPEPLPRREWSRTAIAFLYRAAVLYICTAPVYPRVVVVARPRVVTVVGLGMTSTYLEPSHEVALEGLRD